MAKAKKPKPKKKPDRIRLIPYNNKPKVLGLWLHCEVDGKIVGCTTRHPDGKWSFFANPQHMKPGVSKIEDIKEWLEKEYPE